MVTRIISTGSKKKTVGPAAWGNDDRGIAERGEGAKAAPRSGVKGEATRKYIYIQQVWH